MERNQLNSFLYEGTVKKIKRTVHETYYTVKQISIIKNKKTGKSVKRIYSHIVVCSNAYSRYKKLEQYIEVGTFVRVIGKLKNKIITEVQKGNSIVIIPTDIETRGCKSLMGKNFGKLRAGLNSLLIAGVVKDVVITKNIVYFTLVSKAYKKQDDAIFTEETTVSCVYSVNSTRWVKNLEEGSIVCVIGKAPFTTSKKIVVADHIDCKPTNVEKTYKAKI